jgi:ribosomal protein S18 acetylase RimI-like enzyme
MGKLIRHPSNKKMIRQVTIHDDFDQLARLLNESYLTIVDDFGITQENCPSHNAYINGDTLKSKLIPIREFYRLEDNNKPIGFIVIEKSENDKDTYYIEKVAIHPDYRHKGKGKQIMMFAENRINELGGKQISVGLIDENKRLKDWYKSLGYKETGTKIFDHFPFNVCFMDKYI